MSSPKNFYHEHKEDNDLCSVFCITCQKIAYNTKENKYLKDQEKCAGFDNLQCLNSSCLNGFSTTYQHYVADNRRKVNKKNSYLISSTSVAAASSYMDRSVLN